MSLAVLRICLLVAVVGAGARAFPLSPDEAGELQRKAAAGLNTPVERTVALPGVQALSLVLVPGGEFTMGSPEGESGLDPDESPQFQVTVEPFWMSTCEITNAQYAAFDPAHDSRFMDTYWKDRVGPGFALNGPRQPVVRVSCDSAEEFGHWLSISTGEQYRLPTEREWEYACRAGSAGPFSCQVTDLAAWANLADRSLGDLRPWALRDDALSDGAPVTADVGRYRPNAWGLFDMHGNVQEWCSSIYQAYPLTGPDVPADPSARGQRVVRGGSFDDRPRRARSAFRLSYPATQAIYNVGFRVVCPATSRREEAAGR